MRTCERHPPCTGATLTLTRPSRMTRSHMIRTWNPFSTRAHQTHTRTRARAHARMAAATDFLRFAGYTWAPANSNKCPATFFHIATADACSVAAAANGKTYGGPYAGPDAPKGCFWHQQGGNIVYFNTHPVGSAIPGTLPLCIGAPLRRQCVCCARGRSEHAEHAQQVRAQRIRRHAVDR